MNHAAIISSSFLSGRPTSSAVRTIVRSIAVTTTKKQPSPASCCCRKGKCREFPQLSPYDDVGHFILSSIHCTADLGVKPFQAHGRLRRFRRMFANTITHSDVFRTSPSFTMFSRSIASASAVPRRQATTSASRQSGSQSTRLLNFRDKNFPQSQSNLQEVWDAFSDLPHEGGLEHLDARELLSFGGMILRDTGLTGEVMANSVDWGHRLERLVVELKKRSPFRLGADTLQMECLIIAAHALQGHNDEASAALVSLLRSNPSAAEHTRWILDSFKHVLLSILHHESAPQAIEFYLDNYKLLKQILTRGLAEGQSSSRMYSRLPELSAVFRALDSPASFIASKRNVWDKMRILSLGVTMIRVLCRDGPAEDALDVYEELKRQNIVVFYFVVHALVRALAKAERFERANLLYVSIAPNSSDDAETRSYDATGLFLFAHQGDVERAEECFERLSSRGGVLPQEMTLVMHASAVAGDTKRVIELFDGFFGEPTQGSETSVHKPNLFHYGAVINAYSVRDDVDGMNQWLGRMIKDGYTPDLPIYNIVLKGVAQRDDLKSIHALLDQMRAAGVPPNIYSYTTVIQILARRRDVLGTEALVKRMIREGIALDRIAVTTLMNAHVEAGSWRGVIHVFDFISSSQLKDLKLGIEVFNTLLKAYVLIGAPLHVVTSIFHQLETTDIRPTNRTFALLIQSACASGRMDIASRLFIEMESLEKNWTTDVEVTKEVLTILMAAYLRQGNQDQARVIYEDMQRRGIQPTAYTYASILRSYSNVAFEENVRIAQDFLGSLVSKPSDERAWEQPASGRESAMAFVYAPLMNAHAKKLDVESAERLYQEFMEHGKQPTIGILALLMDAYRRTGDIEGVQRVWPNIVQLALDRTDEVDKLLHPTDAQSKFFRSRRRGDLLTIPLSIYIDALSHAGQHIEIAHTWNRLRDEGFQFDAHNWNHLVVALVRAGQPARAFEVVEKVIIPYQLQSHSIFRSRHEKPDSPLVFDNEQTQTEIEDEPFLGKMERSSRKRPSLIERLRRRFSGEGRKENDDIAHELHLMQQISPEWNVWRPHAVTMQVLARVLERLDSGRLIRPTKPQPRVVEEVQEVQKVQEVAEVERVAEVEEDDLVEDQLSEDQLIEDQPPSEEEAQEARSILNEILSTYPQTILKIDRWENEVAIQTNRESKHFIRQTRHELHQLRRGLG